MIDIVFIESHRERASSELRRAPSGKLYGRGGRSVDVKLIKLTQVFTCILFHHYYLNSSLFHAIFKTV